MAKYKHKNVVGGTLYVSKKSGLISTKIIAQSGSNLTIDPVIPIEEGDVCVIHSDVKSQLFRTVSITENTDEGTYTISAVSHDPAKYGEVDAAANFPTTVNKADSAEINNITVTDEGGKVNVGWDGSLSGSYVSYDVKIYRNGTFFRHIPDAKTPNVELSGLPCGNYRIEIRGRTAKGTLSEPQVKTFVIDYTVTGFQSRSGLYSIQLSWANPATVVNQACTEIFCSTENQIDKAKLLVSIPYPTSTYTVQNVKLADKFYFWARFKDESGVTGDFTSAVLGMADPDPQPILDQINGSLTMDQFQPDVADKLLEQVYDYAGDSSENAGDDRVQAGHWDAYSQVTSGDYALTKEIKAAKAQFNQNIATVAEQITTLADKNHAESEKLAVVAAQVEGSKAQVTELAKSYADLNGKLTATWQVQVSVDKGTGQPVVGGVQLGVNGETGKSEFVVQADKFAVWTGKKVPLLTVQEGVLGLNGDLVLSGTLSGKTLIGNELRGGRINGGSLNIGDGRFVVDNSGRVSMRENPTANVGMVYNSRSFKVYNEAGELCSILGYLLDK